MRRSKEEIQKEKQEKEERKKQKAIKKELKKQEKLTKSQIHTDWCELYEYVKRDIMGYSDDMVLPKFIVLRLKGLSKGEFISNSKSKLKPMANYDYTTILYTFKMYKQDILFGFMKNNTKFKDENHKFNYAMVIIESNINDVVMRLEKSKQAKEKAQNLNIEVVEHESAEFKRKNKKENINLNSIW